MLLEPRRRDDDAPGMRGAVSRSAPATLCANTGHIIVVVGEPSDHVVGYPAGGGVRRPKPVRLCTPERPVRTGRSGNKVRKFRRALDAGGSVKPLVSHVLRLRCAARRARPTSPRAGSPFRSSTCSAARRDTGSALRRIGFHELGFATLHRDGRDRVRVRLCVKKHSEGHTRDQPGCGRARHDGPALLDLES